MKKLVQFGAGNIGRSFIGQLFSRAGWEVVFVDVDEAVISALNERRGYTVEIRDDKSETWRIENVRGVDARDTEAVAVEVAAADCLGSAVGKNYLTAIVTLDRAETETFARQHRISFSSFEELTKHPKIVEVVSGGIDTVNGKLAKFETIKKFAILPREFSQEEGEITPTLKVKRRVITDRYRELLESLYV